MRAYESFSRGDLAGCVALTDPEVEIHELDELPETEVFRGHDGVRKFFALNSKRAGWHSAA